VKEEEMMTNKCS